jgi:hypothetical protein
MARKDDDHVSTAAERGRPLADVIEEGGRLLAQAKNQGVVVSLLGGIAIALRREGRAPLLPREFKDIDLMTQKGQGGAVSRLLEGAGYRSDFEFNAMNGRTRLLFWDDLNMRQVDVFIGAFEMSHRLPLGEALRPGAATISLADLLATKLQIFELNPKDQIDILNVLYDHPVVVDSPDDSGISARRLAELCAADWCFWRTAKLNVDRTLRAIEDGAVAGEPAAVIRSRLLQLWDVVEREPKPRKWRLRNRIGDRVQWYELPEEVR